MTKQEKDRLIDNPNEPVFKEPPLRVQEEYVDKMVKKDEEERASDRRAPVTVPGFWFFYRKSQTIAKANMWRKGQALFNHLLDVRPELAEQIRGTHMDPFYSDDVYDSSYMECLEFLVEKWGDE